MVVDILVIAFLLGQVARGFHHGLVRTVFGLVGQLLGLFAGLTLGPRLIAAVPELGASPLASMVTMVGVLLAGVILGEAILGTIGGLLREANTVAPLRATDQGLGAIAGLLIGALITWFVTSAIAPVLPTQAARALNNARTVTAIDKAMPKPVARWASGLTALLDNSGFPDVFAGVGIEPSIAVQPPDAQITDSSGVTKAARSIVKVHADSDACGKASEGTGWVAAPHRVVTNAHVVAGATHVTVQVGGKGLPQDARVVTFDPDLDLAVLAVEALDATPLATSPPLSGGTSAVIAGFPLDGPYRLTPARVRTSLEATGADIYGEPGVKRQVYAVYAGVQPGNSGGPLLTTDGRVAGTVFARSTLDTSTGYVLTNAATQRLIAQGTTATKAVSTQHCVTE